MTDEDIRPDESLRAYLMRTGHFDKPKTPEIDKLRQWTARQMPGLDSVLSKAGPMHKVGELLNLVTGAKVELNKGTREDGARRFLNAFQAMPKEERQEIERKARNGELS